MRARVPIGIVGAAGAVGRELGLLLAERGLAPARLLGSRRRRLEVAGERRGQSPIGTAAFDQLDLVFFCAPAAVARRWVEAALAAGCAVIDNSSAYRLDPAVPLVVPEINGEELDAAPASGDRRGRLVANPNCSTILLALAVAPLHRAFGCRRLVVSTYQAVSGAGAAAMQELLDQTRDALAGRPLRPRAFREPIAFNVFSHDAAVDPDSGYNGEEEKMARELTRLLRRPPRLTASCVRVPTLRAHCEAVTLELRRPATEEAVRETLARAPGVRLVDERRSNRFPTAAAAAHRDEVLVGRIRPDRSLRPAADGRWRSFHLFLAGDQLRKGAALNALQIADLLFPERWGAPPLPAPPA